MNVLFLQSNTNRALMPLPNGPAMVARQLERDGHQVTFTDLMGERDAAAAASAAARRTRPDLICCSVRNRDNQWLQRFDDPLPGIREMLAAVRRETSAPLLLGGTAFTTFPARMLDELGADYGIAGDTLADVSRFVHSLAAGSPDLETPGLVYRAENGIVRRPFAITGYPQLELDFHRLIDRRRYRRCYWQAAVITRTGCPERCAYCDARTTFGGDFVLREPGDIVEELHYVRRVCGARSVWLVDGGFNRPLDHAKAILEEVVRRGPRLRLYGIFDPGQADREFFQLFRRAGGTGFVMFAESLADSVLEALNKPFRVAEILRDTRLMREEGVGFMFMPTFGSPGETPATVEETLRLTPRLRALWVEFGIGWRLQPDTPLQQHAVAEGLITPEDDLWNATFYVSPATPVEWLKPRLRAFRRRHPFLWGPIVPFMIRSALNRRRDFRYHEKSATRVALS